MLVPVMTRLGYDRVTVVLVTLAATQVGFATSWMNPFSIAIAQGIADLPLLSGMPLRIFMWSVFTLFGMAFTVRYASRIRVTPEPGAATQASERPTLSTGDWLVLAALVTARFGAGQGARRSALGSVAGFALMLIAVIGVGMLA